MTTIYALTNPETNQMFYVGKTKDPIARARQHRQAAGVFVSWTPAFSVLEEVSDERADVREMFWIAHLRSGGIKLTNRTDGGTGGWGHVVSLEHRETIGARYRGKKLSSETRAKLSKAQRGRVPSAEHRAKLSLSAMGHAVSAETRAKMSASHRKRFSQFREISAATAKEKTS